MLRSIARPCMAATRVAAQRSTLAARSVSSDSAGVPYAATPDEFFEVLNGAGQKLVCVDFTATWCGPCKFIGPIFEELAEKHKENVVCVKVDVDENAETAQDCGIAAMPTFQFYRNLKKIAEFSGADPNKLEALLQEHA